MHGQRQATCSNVMADPCKTTEGIIASSDCIDMEGVVSDSADISQDVVESIAGETMSTTASDTQAEGLTEFATNATAEATSLMKCLRAIDTEAAATLGFFADPVDLGLGEVE